MEEGKQSRRNLFDYHTPALSKRTIVTKRQRAKMRQFKSISAYILCSAVSIFKQFMSLLESYVYGTVYIYIFLVQIFCAAKVVHMTNIFSGFFINSFVFFQNEIVE